MRLGNNVTSRQKSNKRLAPEDLLTWAQEQIPTDAKIGDPVLVVINLVAQEVVGAPYYILKPLFRIGYLNDLSILVSDKSITFPVQSYLRFDGVIKHKVQGKMIVPFVDGLSENLLSIDIYNSVPRIQEWMYWKNNSKSDSYERFLEKKRFLDLEQQRYPRDKLGYIFPVEIVVGHGQIQEFCMHRHPFFMHHYLSFWYCYTSSPRYPLSHGYRELDKKKRVYVANQLVDIWKNVASREDLATSLFKLDRLTRLTKQALCMGMDKQEHVMYPDTTPGHTLNVKELVTWTRDYLREKGVSIG